MGCLCHSSTSACCFGSDRSVLFVLFSPQRLPGNCFFRMVMANTDSAKRNRVSCVCVFQRMCIVWGHDRRELACVVSPMMLLIFVNIYFLAIFYLFPLQHLLSCSLPCVQFSSGWKHAICPLILLICVSLTNILYKVSNERTL